MGPLTGWKCAPSVPALPSSAPTPATGTLSAAQGRALFCCAERRGMTRREHGVSCKCRSGCLHRAEPERKLEGPSNYAARSSTPVLGQFVDQSAYATLSQRSTDTPATVLPAGASCGSPAAPGVQPRFRPLVAPTLGSVWAPEGGVGHLVYGAGLPPATFRASDDGDDGVNGGSGIGAGSENGGGEPPAPVIRKSTSVAPAPPICCPKLYYPLNLDGPTVGKKGAARLPQYKRPLHKKFPHCREISFSFSWKAKFDPAPSPCRCSCCEFRQILLKNDVTLEQQGLGSGSGSGGESWNRTYPDPGAGKEDCRWTYQIHELRPPHMPIKDATYVRFGGPDREPGPYSPPPPSTLLKGPECYGHRRKGADGTGPDPDPGYPAGDDCLYSGKDTPTVIIPPKCTFTWIWKAKAFILDTCSGGEHEVRFLDVKVTGETDSTGGVDNLHLTQTVTQYHSRPAYPGER